MYKMKFLSCVFFVISNTYTSNNKTNYLGTFFIWVVMRAMGPFWGSVWTNVPDDVSELIYSLFLRCTLSKTIRIINVPFPLNEVVMGHRSPLNYRLGHRTLRYKVAVIDIYVMPKMRYENIFHLKLSLCLFNWRGHFLARFFTSKVNTQDEPGLESHYLPPGILLTRKRPSHLS